MINFKIGDRVRIEGPDGRTGIIGYIGVDVGQNIRVDGYDVFNGVQQDWTTWHSAAQLTRDPEIVIDRNMRGTP